MSNIIKKAVTENLAESFSGDVINEYKIDKYPETDSDNEKDIIGEVTSTHSRDIRLVGEVATDWMFGKDLSKVFNAVSVAKKFMRKVYG